ncbi:MAG: FMN-binding negative transcriptional regulator [Paracoccaceae bacterium]
MHPNPVFRSESEKTNLSFARNRAFGTLCISAEPVPQLAHVPFTINDAGTEVELHLVRSNPITRSITSSVPAVISVLGPDSYISPDWYGVPDQVPTWNYVAVHLRGTLSLLPGDELPGILDRLTAQFENQLKPKPVWTRDKISTDALGRMMRMIVPFRMLIDDVQGTWKLAQNKPDSARAGAAASVAVDGIGHEIKSLANLMRDIPKT